MTDADWQRTWPEYRCRVRVIMPDQAVRFGVAIASWLRPPVLAVDLDDGHRLQVHPRWVRPVTETTS